MNTVSIKFLLFKKSFLTLSALFICCVSASVVCGKDTFFLPDDEYLQTVWTTEDGLPQNSINGILQSRDGYLWLATFGGLARFDGVKFTTFNSANTPGLMSNRILSVCEDRDGTIWMGTQPGEIMTLKNGVGKTYTIADGLTGMEVSAILEAADGTIWAATAGGLVRFQNGKFVVYNSQNGLLDEHPQNIEKTDDNSLWIFTEKGIVQFKDGNFRAFNPPEGFQKESWLIVAGRRHGNLWVNTENGLASFSDGKFIAYPNSGVSEKIIRTLFEDEDGTLWAVYLPSGTLYKLKDGISTVFPIKEKQATVKNIFKDRERNLWMGTNGSGLIVPYGFNSSWLCHENKEKRFFRFNSSRLCRGKNLIQLKERKLLTFSTANGLPSDGVRAVTGDGNGGVWISTEAGLAHLLDGKFTIYTFNDGMLGGESLALCLDRAGVLWIGSDRGLTRFEDGKFSNFTTADGLIDSPIAALFEDRDGNLWIGTSKGAMKMRDGQFTRFSQSDGLVSNNISFITQTTDGAVWFATVGGLSRLQDGKFTNYTTEQGLSINYVRDVYEEPNGTLWLGTYGGGLNRLKDGKITAVTMRDGLYDDFISRILPDERGNLWMLGNRGIFRASAAELNNFAEKQSKSFNVVSYNVADGMLSSEGNGGSQPAGWRTRDGKMWFPTIKGIAVIDPNVSSELLAPPVIIEKVTVDRNEISFAQTLEINPGQENLEIQYTGINFSRPEQVKFKYADRLTPFNAVGEKYPQTNRRRKNKQGNRRRAFRQLSNRRNASRQHRPKIGFTRFSSPRQICHRSQIRALKSPASNQFTILKIRVST